MIIVDTSVWIDYLSGVLNPHTEWLDQNLGIASIGFLDLILCEILQGIRADSDFTRIQHELSNFALFSSGGEELAIAAASNYRYLKSRGYTVRKTIDCLIATFCLRQGHSLLHRDRDFDPFEQHLTLRVVHPEGQGKN